jgi:hypothetical protein
MTKSGITQQTVWGIKIYHLVREIGIGDYYGELVRIEQLS